ncbi:hypothetical protein O181_078774 [Austropuccinia psidii MF-1]|uniref:Integrase catalytic domain-containing protein n=1 Tax=Austropuccinia psidii MF-1 TaxID=1389203 RepID=A0A9Q3FHK1_9BASI|nr:hypothetical protein [Austropuccinia psidii MF-1]
MVELPSFPSFEWDVLVIDTPKREDLLLGFEFFNHFNPSIDWRNGLITFNSDNKDYYDPSNSFSNDFSSSKSCAAVEAHVTHVSTFLSRLRANNLFPKTSKCLFHVSSVEYLGYIVSSEGLKMDQENVQQILNCPPPRNLKTLQSSLGFPSFYHCFIKNYSKKASSLTSFLKKGSNFPLNEEALRQFHQLKEAFTTAAILPYLPLKEYNHHKNFGLLEPIPIPNCPLILDRFSKLEVFIPTFSLINSIDLAHLFIKNVFSKNELPSSIISDRCSLFVSSFSTNLCQQLKISRDLSAAYHPETDGQTERVNQILEQYLWIYVSYHQEGWNTWLPLSEFAYNNSEHSSTKKSPFFTFNGRDPQFDSDHNTQDNPAGKLSTKVQSLQKDVKRELEVSINRIKRYADKSRASLPVFNLGDMKVSTHAYHLKLPSQWKSIQPVLHIPLLEPVKTSTIPNRNQAPPPLTIIEEE